MSDEPCVLDSSAVLALLQKEAGADAVAGALRDAVISAVNLSEVVAKLVDHGIPARAARSALEGLSLNVRPFDHEAAYAAGELRRTTRSAGLSFGDRACLALAMQLRATVLTADRAWSSLGDGVSITVIR